MSDLDINDNVLAELRAAADIVDVISEHTRLKKGGRSWKGLCPFHNERTPVLHGGSGQGALPLLRLRRGRRRHPLRPPDRPARLPRGDRGARRPVRRHDPETRSRAARGTSSAKSSSRRSPRRSGSTPRSSRSPETAPPSTSRNAAFRSPSRRLSDSATPRPAGRRSRRASAESGPEDVLVEAGLLQSRTEGRGLLRPLPEPASLHDPRRARSSGRFQRARPLARGRAEVPELPGVAGLPRRSGCSTRSPTRATRSAGGERAVLAEGCFDHLALFLAGVEETVASMGTALTPEQSAKLKRLAPKVVLCYDGDAAGRIGGARRDRAPARPGAPRSLSRSCRTAKIRTTCCRAGRPRSARGPDRSGAGLPLVADRCARAGGGRALAGGEKG